jgi:predicted nucleic acid-binding protein
MMPQIKSPSRARIHDQIAALPVKGTLGILVEAKRQGLVPAVRPLIEGMIANGYRLAPELVVSVLAAVGETAV